MRRTEAEILREKVNIGSHARKIMSHGIQESFSPDPLDENFLGQKDAEKVWLAHAEEGYALAGILTHEVIEHARSQKDNFPPYGLKRISHPQNPDVLEPVHDVENLHALSDAFLLSLMVSKASVFKKLEDQSRTDPNQLSTIYERYKKNTRIF